MDSLIVADGFGKNFGDRWLWRDMDFDIAAGDIVALRGESGSGKTTFLNCLGGLEPSQGELKVARGRRRRFCGQGMTGSAGRRLARRSGMVACLALSLPVLAGCTGEAYQLPQVDGASPTTGTTAADPAKAYFDCMVAAGLPVKWVDVGAPGGRVVELAPGPNDSFISETPDGGSGSSRTVDEATRAALAAATTAFKLALNGVDRSVDYQRCHDQSGYDEAAALGQQLGPDSTAMARMMEASLSWARCARSAGWPQVADPVMPSVGSDWPPMVLLPVTITADQVRELVRVCPVEPLVDGEASSPAATDGPDSWAEIYPTIGFDYPGFDGQSHPIGQASADPTAVRLAELTEILYGPPGLVYQGQGPPS